MFTKGELLVISGALIVQQKSVIRLASKEGQPETVAAEYRKVSKQIDDVMKKVVAAIDAEPKKDELKK